MFSSKLRGNVVGLLFDGVVPGKIGCTLRRTTGQFVSVLVELGFDLSVIECAFSQFAGDVTFLNPATHQGILDLGSTGTELFASL